MELLVYFLPQHVRSGGRVFKNFAISFFPGEPKNKAGDKSPKLVDDVTFKGAVHPFFESFSTIAFYSVGMSKSHSHEVP